MDHSLEVLPIRLHRRHRDCVHSTLVEEHDAELVVSSISYTQRIAFGPVGKHNSHRSHVIPHDSHPRISHAQNPLPGLSVPRSAAERIADQVRRGIRVLKHPAPSIPPLRPRKSFSGEPAGFGGCCEGV